MKLQLMKGTNGKRWRGALMIKPTNAATAAMARQVNSVSAGMMKTSMSRTSTSPRPKVAVSWASKYSPTSKASTR